MKLLSKLLLLLTFHFVAVQSEKLVGGTRKVEDIEPIKQLLQENIHKLNLTIVKIIDAQQQVVAGILYKVNGIFKDEDGNHFNCSIDIWKRDWLENVEEKLILTLKSQTKVDYEDAKPVEKEAPSSSLKSSNLSKYLLAVAVFLSLLLLRK